LLLACILESVGLRVGVKTLRNTIITNQQETTTTQRAPAACKLL